MSFTKEEREKIGKWFSSKNLTECRLCGGTHVDFSTRYRRLPVMEDVWMDSDDLHPVVSKVCQQCANVTFFDAQQMGLF
jgi:hypothetical protein